MQPIWVRPAEPKDAGLLADWMAKARAINIFDMDIVNYPSLQVLCAHNSEPLLYMPLQLVVMLESLAPKPGITPREEALALRELAHAVVLLAKQHKVSEVYFLCKDQRVVDFATAHGFQQMPDHVKTLRLKLDKLESSHEANPNTRTA